MNAAENSKTNYPYTIFLYKPACARTGADNTESQKWCWWNLTLESRPIRRGAEHILERTHENGLSLTTNIILFIVRLLTVPWQLYVNYVSAPCVHGWYMSLIIQKYTSPPSQILVAILHAFKIRRWNRWCFKHVPTGACRAAAVAWISSGRWYPT